MLAVVLKSFRFTASRALTLLLLLQHYLFPLLLKLKPLSERSAFRLPLHNTRVVFLLLKEPSCEHETEAEVILTLLIKPIGGEIDACEPRPAWAD
jgi:hypothetical protein